MDKNSDHLIIVSNRLPVTVSTNTGGIPKITKSSGGLVSGLAHIHQHYKTCWVGYSGVCQEDSAYPSVKQLLKQQGLLCVSLEQSVYETYYNGICNNVIWPLFHYFPDKVQFCAEQWAIYQQVNQQFADALLPIIRKDSKIWIHDYHLMLLPGLLRKLYPNLPIAYFHHIPFPSFDLFRILPYRQEILDGLLGADLIGFHTEEYVRHFLSSITEVMNAPCQKGWIAYQNRHIHAIAAPLGVDCQMIRSAKRKVSGSSCALLKKVFSKQKMILGIDRLDYTKGIPERLLAFKQFLRTHPDKIGKVALVQIGVPSRMDLQSYQTLKHEVEQLVGEINGEFGSTDYTPIHYFYRSFSRRALIQFYQRADVMFVTPLRDGLNLVCKEYVTARHDVDGVVILSELAGACAEMREALLVNPYDQAQVVQALYKAITMPKAMRQSKMQGLRARILPMTNLAWMRLFLKQWQLAWKNNHDRMPITRKKQLTTWVNSTLSWDEGLTVIDHNEVNHQKKIQKSPVFARSNSHQISMIARRLV